MSSTAGRAFLQARDFLLAHRTDSARAAGGFAWPALGQFNWALDYFDAIATDNHTPALHIVDEGGREHLRTFADLSIDSNRVAHYFAGLGVRKGDRVMVMLGNEVTLWETLLAAIKLGAIVTPATALLTTSDLSDRIERGRVSYVIAHASNAGKFDDVPGTYTRIAAGGRPPGWHALDECRGFDGAFRPEGLTDASDPMLLYFTSGTTSRPKLVVHTHQSYPVGHLSTMYWAGLRPGDRHWNISSPGWAKHAWSSFFAPWNAQATTFSFNYARFNARNVLIALAQYGITSLCAPPTVWRMLVQEPLGEYRVPLREALSAGEPLNPEVINAVRKSWGITIRDGYGQTETTAQIANQPGQPVRAGSMGTALPGYTIVLLDAEGNPSAREGEICLPLDSRRPVGLTDGYADDEGRNAEAMRGGYYHTGDIALRDEDGYFTFVGRVDDVFKASDYRLSPFELESVLVEHPAVVEAAVVPSPDPIRHAVPKAFVVLAPGYEPGPAIASDILAYCRSALAPYKRIRRIEFAELPKTISGKIRRVELRAMERERRASGERVAFEYFEEEL